MFKTSFLYLLILFTCSFLQAQKGTITKIIDGDTYLIQISESNETIKVRLWGIDAPEKNQAFGVTATNYCIDRYLDKTVEISIKDVDRYGRTVAVLSISDEVFNEHLIKVGLAWDYHYYSKSAVYANLQKLAKVSKVGLWIEKKPIEPRSWRKSH